MAPARPRAVDPGDRCLGRGRVTRAVDLGHDLDEVLCRVLHDLAVVGLRVEPRSAGSRRPAALGRAADRRELWPRVDGEAPTLVVRQVHVQGVQLVERHLVDESLDIVDGEEPTPDIEHRTAVLVARGVADADGRDRPRSIDRVNRLDLVREQLPQRRHAAEQSFGVVRLDRDPRAVDLEHIALVTECRIAPRRELDRGALGGASCTLPDRDRVPRRPPEELGELRTHGDGRVIEGVGLDDRSDTEHGRGSGRALKARRRGDDRDVGRWFDGFFCGRRHRRCSEQHEGADHGGRGRKGRGSQPCPSGHLLSPLTVVDRSLVRSASKGSGA